MTGKKTITPAERSVRIGPMRYAVKDVEGLAERGYIGQCNSVSCEIHLEPTQHPAKKRATLFHEILHAVSDTYDIKLTERQVNLLEAGLLNLFDDNPDLLTEGTP